MFVTALRVAAAGLLAALIAPTGPAAPVPADRAKAEKELAALKAKLHGEWRGQGGCVGDLTLQPDGTYAWTGFGPSAREDAGTWGMRWDGLSPTLILKCKTADDLDRNGTTAEAKFVRVDDSSLSFKYPEAVEPLKFSRTKKAGGL